jgi:Na+/melibiose symporter-like transporter
MEVLLFLGYVALCLLVGILGRQTRVGYWGTVVISIVITPFLTFLLLFFFASRETRDAPRNTPTGS